MAKGEFQSPKWNRTESPSRLGRVGSCSGRRSSESPVKRPPRTKKVTVDDVGALDGKAVGDNVEGSAGGPVSVVGASTGASVVEIGAAAGAAAGALVAEEAAGLEVDSGGVAGATGVVGAPATGGEKSVGAG